MYLPPQFQSVQTFHGLTSSFLAISSNDALGAVLQLAEIQWPVANPPSTVARVEKSGPAKAERALKAPKVGPGEAIFVEFTTSTDFHHVPFPSFSLNPPQTP